MSELQNNTSEKLLILNDELFYGSGRQQKCYLHPSKDNLCIKIAYNRGGQIDLSREVNYIKILKSVIKIIIFYQNFTVKLKQI